MFLENFVKLLPICFLLIGMQIISDGNALSCPKEYIVHGGVMVTCFLVF